MDSTGPREIHVSNIGGYVRVYGQGEFSPKTHNYVLTKEVQRIVVRGTNRAETIDLKAVHPVIYSSLAETKIEGRGRRDVIYGSGVNDLILGGKGNDVIRGMGGDDEIRGGPGHDEIFGDAGADRIYGGSGNDYIWGAGYHADDRDVDRVFGGGGIDTYGIRNRYAGLNDKIRGFEIDLRK